MKSYVTLAMVFLGFCLIVAEAREDEKDWEEIKIYFNASEDPQHQFKPFATPILAGYFAWDCRLVLTEGNRYLCWDYQLSPIPQGVTSFDAIAEHLETTTTYYGFVFEGVLHSNATLPKHTHLKIIGRYTTNAEVTLKNGETQLVPILSDVYVWKASECNSYDCETHQSDPRLFQSPQYQERIRKKFPVSLKMINTRN